ncbi:tyrosine/phenylalanine carboxypeptidase domain-containing protein [Candidatus Vampirococcus lugosii]|uniref:Alpha-L-glutamate ligase-related protein n=1 Tax=Candidatus Vampirococcus lugosii TaxID=2789015 RepID=A0ABS5QLA2_9BACT|nr:tyrosine/phenylalanine carboxypeptidase domain-containing protein [Candidatus Vampirococcus lugosii]MBS8121842.1 Alpha-L-glutamate ligase-related protein [Candidatus Vampirococcus lugosii]
MFNSGILGINSRNLQYIKKFNPKKVTRLADNKQKTKNFLKERGIPVPQTYGIISNRSQLYDFDFAKMPSKNFVVKPNKGSKGKGIYIVKYIDELKNQLKNSGENIVSKKNNFLKSFLGFDLKSKFDYHYKTGGEIISDDVLRRYLVDILDGRYSITFGQDKILVEEKLNPGINFRKYCRHGLADIRVIVFNLIPVAAMIRVPTAESGGKANIAQGGVGLGVEVGSGKVKSMYFKKEIFTKSFPGEYADIYNKKVPFWNDILMYSSEIQYFVNLGYLALDWVVTDDGPKLLEINARAGLEVQSASVLKLRNRLEKISDIHVNDPQKGVEISKSIFNSSKNNLINMSKILYLSQKGNLIFEGIQDNFVKITIMVDIKKEKNYISKKLYNKIDSYKSGDVILDIPENEIRLKNLIFEVNDKMEENEIILGQGSISEFYIKPIHKIETDINIVSSSNIDDEEIETLHIIDQNIAKISRKLNFTKILTPTNYLDELDNFVTWNGNYNPKFSYNFLDENTINSLETELLGMKDKYFSNNFGLKSNFSELFNEKIDELLDRLYLIKAYKLQKYGYILEYNEKLFGNFDKKLVEQSKEKIFMEPVQDMNLLGEKLTFSQVKKIIKKYLYDKGISGVKINTSMGLSRMAVIKGKYPEIRISSYSSFREKELLATLAHEIDVHLIRFLNGKKTGWEILKSGTGYYIKDEEGFAVYNSFNYLPEGYEKKAIYQKYYLSFISGYYGFSRLVDIIRGIQYRSLEGAFKTALRLKKGIQNTGFVDRGAVYTKDKIYLDGYMKVDERIKNGGNFDEFKFGKIKIEDIDKVL